MQVREPRDHRSGSIVGAHLVLIRNRAVLLGQRHPNSAYAPSAWHLPAGHREQGEPAVLEPDRCMRWQWWPLSALPDPTVECTRVALEAFSRGTTYTAQGWG